jgi:prevent-host-death family protein
MSRIVSIHDAKAHLSRLIDDVAAGAEVVIAESGKPMARLVAIATVAKQKRLGLLKGKIQVPEDFNAPLYEEVTRGFEGG